MTEPEPPQPAPPPPAAPPASLAQFWPFYLREHAKPLTRAWHYLGSGLALAFLIATLATGDLWLLAAMVLAGYAPAWIGHFFVEGNRPATFRHPFWSLICDWRMAAAWVSGRLGSELTRAGVYSTRARR